MCGIVGFVGQEDRMDVSRILLDSLTQLEYRGYDSAGIAVLNHEGGLDVKKCKGRLANLEEMVKREPVVGNCGIGHTRWATHGEPNDVNSHPHTNVSGSIAIVHNGIIENYAQLHKRLEKNGVTFRSETDSECVAHLINSYYQGDILDAVTQAVKELEGSFALGVICKNDPGVIVVARKDCPLVIGQGVDANYLASDVTPLLAYTREVQYLDNNQIAKITAEKVDVYENGECVDVPLSHVDWDLQSAQKGGFEHFMLKEICEQPNAIDQTYRARVYGGILDLKDIEDLVQSCKRVVMLGCGTAYHATVVGKYVIEHFARIPVEVDVASEFRYRDPIITSEDLCIVISQSGETADTLQGLRLLKSKGAKVIAITNVVGSSVAREADKVLYTQAGPEIAVASTKAFTTQLLSVYLLSCALTKDKTLKAKMLAELATLSEKSAEVLKQQDVLQKFASRRFNKSKVFYLGRQVDFAISLESALKLKEISYTHSEAFAAGELKHGPIALVDNDTLVVATCTQPELYDKMDSNMKEVKARGADVLAITFEGNDRFDDLADTVFKIPVTEPYFSSILVVIVTQIYAYYCSVYKGIDPDKPRNLAKSVTVE